MTITASRFATRIFVACLTLGAASATSFDAVTNFSLTTNVASNIWSYWATPSTTISTYASNVALLPVLFDTTCGFGTSCWDVTSGINNLVLQNVTGADAFFTPTPGTTDARNNQLAYFDRGGIVLVRFTAPSAGSYSVSGFFEGDTDSPVSSTEFIDVNGNVGSPQLNATGVVAEGTTNHFNFVVSLSANNTIDFLIAGTPSSDYNSLATGFDATITPATGTPEPGSLLLVGVGLLAGLARFRKYSA